MLQPSHVPSVPTGQGHPNTPMPHAYHHASKPANEAFNSGRTELPEVIVTSDFSSQSLHFMYTCICLLFV